MQTSNDYIATFYKKAHSKSTVCEKHAARTIMPEESQKMFLLVVCLKPATIATTAGVVHVRYMTELK